MRGIWETLRGWLAGKGTADRAGIGEAGERAAEAHLRAAGLKILARNWRNPADEREELDLVCADGSVLVFVEVKTRAAQARVSGYHAVNRRKKDVLLRVSRAYLARLRPPARHYRFDIVEVAHGATEASCRGVQAMGLDPALASERGGMQVWHYRDVPLFRDRANHRHG
jgi:putative endonuclease